MDIRYCIFQLRFFGVPKERFYTYFANAIPKDWKVFVLDRAPGIPVSPAPHIEPVDMYSNEVYRRKLSVSEIEKEEQWLGHSFASIMSMEDAYFKTSYAPNMKRRMNIARHVRCFREFLTLNKINLCNVGFPNNALGITFYYVAERLKIAHWNGLEIFRGPCPDNAVLPVQYNRVVMLKKPRVSKQKMAEAKQIQRRLFEKKNYRLWEPHTKEVQVSYSMSIENFKTKFEQFKILRANQSPFESHFDMKGITQMYLEKVFRSKMNSVMMRPLLKSQKGNAISISLCTLQEIRQ